MTHQQMTGPRRALADLAAGGPVVVDGGMETLPATPGLETNLRTMMGVRPGQAVTALASAGVTAVGIDLIGACCGSAPEHLGAISRALA